MKVHAQTPKGWIWIEMPDPPPQPKSDIHIIKDDLAIIKASLGK